MAVLSEAVSGAQNQRRGYPGTWAGYSWNPEGVFQKTWAGYRPQKRPAHAVAYVAAVVLGCVDFPVRRHAVVRCQGHQQVFPVPSPAAARRFRRGVALC